MPFPDNVQPFNPGATVMTVLAAFARMPASPRRHIAAALVASVVAHVLLAVGVPGLQRNPPAVPPPAIDVVLAPQPRAQPVELPLQVEAQKLDPKPPSRPAVITARSVPDREQHTVVPAPVEPAPAAVQDPVRAAAPAPAAVTTAVPRTEPALLPPSFSAAYLRNPPPRYPLAARRNGEEGTVMLRVLVTAEGAAARVELDRSSGSAALDIAAQEAVRGWRFVPARRGSQTVEDWVRVPVVFRIES